MKAAEVATIKFVDVDSGDKAVAIVRAGENEIGLAFSLASDGDVEVFLRLDDARRLVEALSAAILKASAKRG